MKLSITGYPEGHADSEDKQDDIEYLFQKQEAGADFVVTQLFYCVETFMTWYKACRARGTFEKPECAALHLHLLTSPHPRRHHDPYPPWNHAHPKLPVLPADDEPLQELHPSSDCGRAREDPGALHVARLARLFHDSDGLVLLRSTTIRPSRTMASSSLSR